MDAFISEWWPLITTVLLVLVKVLNKKTPHWSDWAGSAGKVLGLVLEVLDIIKLPQVKKVDHLAEHIRETRR